MLRRSIVVVSVLVAFATMLPVICAQQKQIPAPVSITVIDPTGAVVAAACVTIAGSSQDAHVSKETDAHGTLPVTLPPGGYDITVTSPGFAKTTKHLEVANNSPNSLQIRLPVGTCSPCVEVNSVAPLQLDANMEPSKPRADPTPSKADAKKCEGCGCGSQSN
jgi:Carboxypeptidase regulatory-like domain